MRENTLFILSVEHDTCLVPGAIFRRYLYFSHQIPFGVHFKGKDRPQLTKPTFKSNFPTKTLRTFIQRRKEWLELPDTRELEKYHQSRNIGESASYDYLAYDIENVGVT